MRKERIGPISNLSGTDKHKSMLDNVYNITVSELTADIFHDTMKQDFIAANQVRPDYEQNPETRELMMPVDRYDLLSMIQGQIFDCVEGREPKDEELQRMTNRQLFTLYMDLKIENITRSMRKNGK